MPTPPEQADEYCRQANAHFRAGQIEEAITLYHKAIKIRPDFGEVYSNLSNALLTLGRVEEALAACQQAAVLRPQEPRVHNNLGNVLLALRQYPDAIAAYKRAIDLENTFHEPLYNLGNALRETGQFDQALAMYQQAVRLRPDFAAGHNNLATLLKDMGQIDEALRCYDRALALQPDDWAVHGSKLYSIYFHPSQDRQRLHQEHVGWSQKHAEPLKREISVHSNDRNPTRRLRIGYVSPDFREHCQSFFTLPLLSHHDHENFEIFCYSSVPRVDSLTERIKGFADAWRNMTGLPDAQVAETIRADEIDILIDLTMHMSGGRPLLFARKPAPIQVAWLAYPGTTGMEAIDYRFTDPFLDPAPSTGSTSSPRAGSGQDEVNDAFYSEKSVRLPHSFWCYDPLTDDPKVNVLPALSNGFVTFGCLNNYAKVHDGLLAIWSQVLQAVPNSKLLLLVPQGSARENLHRKLGVEENRLQFVSYQPRAKYLETYLQIDLGLDTFPVNGHTTSLDSMWMGVPVVSLYGQTAISRAGLSQMSNLGLADQFVGRTPEEFVQIAVDWANDLSRLAELRAGLRRHMQNSPLMDGPRFARNIEGAYREMWRQWCAAKPPESFTVTEISIQQLFDSAVNFHKAKRLGEAESLYRQVLSRKPNIAEAMQLLGVVLSQTKRPQEAMELIRQAIAINPKNGNFHYNLGLVLKTIGRMEEAVDSFQNAIALKPEFIEAHMELCAVLEPLNRPEELAPAYRALLKLKPDYAEGHNNLGNALAATGEFTEAIAAYRTALSLRPDVDAAYCNLGNALATAGRPDEAIEILSQRPDMPEAVYNLANTLRDKGDFDAAIAAFRRAISLKPDFAAAHNNLATALKDTGKIEEAIAAYENGIVHSPAHAALQSSRIFTLHYHPKYDGHAILREHQKWNDLHAGPLAGEIRRHGNNRSPDRRLKIGYVSPDFFDHCQSFFTIPLLSNHDHSKFEIYCYSSVQRPDAMTHRLQGYADVWRKTAGYSDAQLTEMIRNDQIDILIDLTMHMSNGRLLTFARKPAPVQVTWLAYPSTTGVSTIDYRLTDSSLDPIGETDENYSERSIRLPHTFWCYDPLTTEPRVSALPALSAGHVTFGCLNNFCKVNDEVLLMWAEVMRAVPDSKMIILSPRGRHRRHVLEFLDESRVTFVQFLPRGEYLKTYHRIDIGLDTFPYNGHTTSLDSLWMGVPVVSLCGKTAVSRAGFSQCSNLGLADQLVARDMEKFIQLAKNLANDLNGLSHLRSTLRTRMQNSPLMDGPRFTRGVESAYREMWRRWCAQAE